MQKKTKATLILIATLSGLIAVLVFIFGTKDESASSLKKETIILPPPKFTSKTSVEEALHKRRSVRDYKESPLRMTEISQLLWAAQGITDPGRGFRTAPSAGALYPLQVYLAAGNVTGLPNGIYKYNPQSHTLTRTSGGDKRAALYEAALSQPAVKKAAAVIVLSAAYERTTVKYGKRGIRYVHMEAGHAAQNLYLQAVSLNLGTVAIGAFRDEELKKIVGMPKEETPLYIMPVGRP